MYSPVRIVDYYEKCQNETIMNLTYLAEKTVSLHLESDKEETTVEEDQVALPQAGIVVSLSIESSWHRPDGCSTHCLFVV